MPNTDTEEKKAFREQFKKSILDDPNSAFAEFLAVAEDATNSTDPVIASKGWERIRELMLMQAMMTGAKPVDIDMDALAAKVSETVSKFDPSQLQAEIDALAKSKDDDFAALSKRITSLETPLDADPKQGA